MPPIGEEHLTSPAAPAHRGRGLPYRSNLPELVLRVAVTGHRPGKNRRFEAADIQRRCVEAFHALAEGLLAARGEPYARTLPTLTLVSGLAEGADQIAAQAMFDGAEPNDYERRLEVILPFSVADFAATFDTDEGREGLHAWLARADSVLALADWTPPPNATDSAVSIHRRDRRFATLADLLVRQADVMIAVWDGAPALGRGGTAEVVAQALAQGVPVIWIDPAGAFTRLLGAAEPFRDFFSSLPKDTPAIGPALNAVLEPILRPPAAQNETSGHRGAHWTARHTLKGYLDFEEGRAVTPWILYDRLLAHPARQTLAKIERRPPLPRPKGPIAINDVAAKLADPAWSGRPAGPGAPRHTDKRAALGEAWGMADAVATGLGHVYRSVYVLIFILSGVAVMFGLLGAILESLEPFLVAMELATLFLAFGIYLAGRGLNHHQRWLQARELAEQMRAYWALSQAGFGGRRPLTPGGPWTAWLFNAFAAPVGVPGITATPQALGCVARSVLEGIVTDQQVYNERNAARLKLVQHRLDGIGGLLQFGAIASSLLLLGMLGYMHANPTGEEALQGLKMTFVALSAGLPAFGAAVAGIGFQGDFERFSERSHLTAEALTTVERGLQDFIAECDAAEPRPTEDAPLFEVLRDILAALESALLADLNDWRFVYRGRTVPEPG